MPPCVRRRPVPSGRRDGGRVPLRARPEPRARTAAGRDVVAVGRAAAAPRAEDVAVLRHHNNGRGGAD